MTLRDRADLTLLAAIWGGSFLLMHVTGAEVGVAAMAAVRLALSALCLSAVLLLGSGFSAVTGHLPQLVFLGLVASALPFLLMGYATVHLSASAASLLNATVPLWAVLISVFWLRRPLSLRQMCGMALATAGVAVLVLGKSNGALSASLVPALAAVGATLCYAVAAHFTREKLHGVPPMVTATVSQIAAAVWLAPVAFWLWPEGSVSAAAMINLMLLGVVATAAAYVLYFRLIRSAGAERTVLVTYLIPLFAALWVWLILDEEPTLMMLLGAALILGGTALAAQKKPISPA